MPETTILALNGPESASTPSGGTTFTYCCECGTYDAHASKCTCCGFDFTGETAADADEID